MNRIRKALIDLDSFVQRLQTMKIQALDFSWERKQSWKCLWCERTFSPSHFSSVEDYQNYIEQHTKECLGSKKLG